MIFSGYLPVSRYFRSNMQFQLVKDLAAGVDKAAQLLVEEVDPKTILFLAGGSTPKSLYEKLATAQVIRPAGVGLIDERYGVPMHEKSNELMIRETGFLDYLDRSNIPFHSMLQQDFDREQDARFYDQKARDLFFHFPRSVAIVGIGKDGHIAGIAPNRTHFTNPMFDPSRANLYVSEFDDPTGPFGQRISMTFAGLALIDLMIVFVFGKDKQKALTEAFTRGRLEDCPARFFQEHEIAKKTLFITDQKL